MYLVVRDPEFGVTIIITIVIIIVSRGEKTGDTGKQIERKTDRTRTKIITYMRGHCAKKQNKIQTAELTFIPC